MTMLGRRRLLQLGSGAAMALFVAGCDAGPTDPSPSPTTPSPTTSPTGRGPSLSIAQGTVGSVGSGRVGFGDHGADVDRVTIWRADDESGFESTVGLRDGDRMFIGGTCWVVSRLASRAGRAFVGFDPVLTKVQAPPADAGLIVAGLRPDDTSSFARIGTGNRMAVVELTARSAVLRHWPGLSKPGDAGVLVPVRAGSTIKVGRVTLTITGFQPPLDRLRGYVALRAARS